VLRSDGVVGCVAAGATRSRRTHCRIEAHYCSLAAAGQARPLLRLCFAMMNEDYSTVIHPSYWDG
jgi:hypothetical protein